MKATIVYFKKFPPRLFILLCLALLLLPFAFKSDASGQRRRPGAGSSGAETGLVFRLSEAQDEPQRLAQSQIARPATEPLSDEATQNLLKRMPPIKAEGDDEKDFALRDRSLPAPRTGQTISEQFPPASGSNQPEQVPSGPLEILRVSPEGDVPIAPHLSVTFSQPMVAVTSTEDLRASQVPVKLSPQPQGKWRWLGTKTLLFDPAVRFPMATNYSVEIPAGTKSATGGALGAAKRWTFSTPPLQVKTSHPRNGPHSRNPLFFIEFDQRIEPDSLLKKIRLSAAGGVWGLRLATADEIAADELVNRMAKAANKDCWIAFRAVARQGDDPQKPLLTGTNYTYTVESGAPSAEGPRVTAGGQAFQFSTYGPLLVKSHHCNYNNNCPPGTPWMIEFNNQLDLEVFDKAQIRVEPQLPGMKVNNYGNWVYIEGQSKGRTVYTVTLAPSIRDIYGQTLGDNKALTFRVGDATPNLAATAEGLAALDPYSQPKFSIFSVNHQQLKVSVYAVGLQHWLQFSTFLLEAQERDYRRGGRSMPAIGRLVSSKVIDVASKQDELTETPIDLKPALTGGLGHVVLSVEAVQPPKTEWERRSLHVWIQATNIGLDAFADQSNLLGWATSLKDGKPLSGVEMAIADPAGVAQARGKTGADGLARLQLPDQAGQKMLVARNGDDTAFLPESVYHYRRRGDYQSEWQKRPRPGDILSWHVFDDRGMYRPGEEVHIKGWLRNVGLGTNGDVAMAGATGVSYILNDSRGNRILNGSARVNAWGGFDAAFKLPPTMNLGHAYLILNAEGGSAVDRNGHNHPIRVQEFRRPEYEVKVVASEGPHFVRDHATLTVAANYYAGGGLADSEVRWHVNATPANFTPPNRGDFTFGKWTPWWLPYGYQGANANSKEFTGRTDASGKHRLRIDLDSVTPPRATSVNATANVQDVNRQSVGSSFNFLVHPAALYVGLRTQRWFVQKGEPLVVESIVTDLDGKAVANREIRMRAALIDWTYDKGEWKERETDPQECVIKSGANATQCRFETREGGRYRITALIYDDRERPNETELTLWVAGGKQPPQRDLAQEKVELIPSGKEYKAGDTAEILVQSPFFPAEGVLTLRRSGLVTSERFTMNSASHTLKIPIKEEYLPNIHVQVDLVGASSRPDDEGKPDPKLPKRPAFASGTINLSIPPNTRKLTVAATPRDKELEPGGETTVDVELRDATGKPAQNAEVALVVVDESVLALTGYKLADPLNTFYFQRGDDVGDYHMREMVQLAKADALISQSGPGAAIRGTAGALRADALPPTPAPTPSARTAMVVQTESVSVDNFALNAAKDSPMSDESIRARIDFNALAFFAASLPTDANGRASVKVKLPDNLTRYRVMAVAVAGEKQFGIGESAITARLPIMARPSAPRFLNFGDRVELPVVVQNQTDQPLKVDVAMRAANAQLTEGQGRRVTVPANDRVEVRFPATTTKPGRARFQIAAASGKWADAAEVSLPVWTPATTEAFATYGAVDAGAIIQPVKAPSDAFKQFGGLEVTTSSTQLQALTDAVIYLTNYPYECAEQIASRVLAIAALRDVLGAFDAKGLPNAEELVAAVDRDVKSLQGMQSPNGGFGFWRRDGETWPYLSIHVAHALQRAKEKGFNTPPEMMERSKQYMRAIEQHIPSWYSAESRRAIIAYALYVRNRMGERDASKARSLIDSAGGVDKLSLEALGWLMPVLSGDANSLAAIRLHLNNRVEETAGAAHFTTSYKDGAQVMLHSDRRADGVILESLIGDSPKSDLIPKIVRGLLAHRKAGRWENTQENCFVLLALDRYFEVYEKATPDFVARAWLGDAFAGGHEFRGRTTDSHQINVPMSYLMAQSGAQNLILSKEGAGRLYYRVGMNYAPTSLQLKPADFGFTVTRVYEAIDNPNDVRRQEDGTWRIKAGAQVRVRLTMVATARRYHVALVDPLPAGFETLNPELAITGRIPQDMNDQSQDNWRRYWWRQWFEHQNMRDERVEAFASLLWDGVYNYSYVARATTPGVFVVPPSKAEEMYHPETFGRGATDRVVIE
ncbi:MAG TPA: DUF6049 family protein [Blastocatellia bacterium]|nr:DUF6049 family protein [Blastocatellia bacterium]